MFIHQHNCSHGSIYDISKSQLREIKSLKEELSRVRDRAEINRNQANTADHDLRKARRTIEMQEAQMANMQKENARLCTKQQSYTCEASLVLKQSNELRQNRESLELLRAENTALHAVQNSSQSNTWVPIERYDKLAAKKDLFKKALAAELDGESSSHIIDILTEEAPKKDCELISIRHPNPMWW